MPALTSAEIADICGGRLHGDPNQIITGANTLEEASEHELCFLSNERVNIAPERLRGGCYLVPRDFPFSGALSAIEVDDPRKAFAIVLQRLYPVAPRRAFRHPTAQISSSALIGDNVSIGAFCSIGEHVLIANACVIAEHCSIGNNAILGEGTELRPNVVIYAAVTIGARCLIHAGCVIGADGFGFAFDRDHYEKFPQIGTVVIGDDVELGANTCIDRAALGSTRVGDGTKIDNLVHIAHNCRLGRHVVVAAQTGFSGGVTVGDYAVIGGQVGIGEKARIESRAVVGSQGGVLPGRKVPAGEPVWGTPARPLRQHLKALAYVNKLPQITDELKRLAEQVEKLKIAEPG